jgi:2-dehydro-3-deoxygalactonokinase
MGGNMSKSQAVVGIDWGTTNRRAYVLDGNGDLLQQTSDKFGILTIGGNFESSLKDLLLQLNVRTADVVMSGMVGSRNGWHEAPYLPVQQPISNLPQAMMEIDCALPDVRCRIVPGYQFTDPLGTPDVMRGEETQIFGAILLGAPDGWFLHPGTHSKWVRVQNQRIAEIVTFMTGELFALLSEHGTLAKLMQEKQEAPAAFEAGVKAAQHGGFTHAAFGCRALVVTDAMPAGHAASYLSGLLIGAELADIRRKAGSHGGRPVQIIGSTALEARYVKALEFFDIPATVWQPDDVYIAALRRLAAEI